MILVAVFQIFDAFCITYTHALRGAGDTKWPAIAIGACCWGIYILGGFAIRRLAPGWGPAGPWVMCTLYITVLGGLLWARFHSGAWQRIRIFSPEPPFEQPGDAAVKPAEPS